VAKASILFLVQLPPPVHGAALRNEFLSKSKVLNTNFDLEVMPLDFAKSIGDVGAFSIMKLVKMIGFSFRLFFKLLSSKYDLVYYNFAVRGIALYRDWLFVRIVKLFSVPLVIHIRTQGVREQAAHSSLKRNIFKNAFRSTTVICLSNALAKDVETVCNTAPKIIANGIDLVVTDADLSAKKSNTVPKFLFLSNLTRSKGVFEFLDSLKILLENNQEFTAEIVGPEFDVKIGFLQQYLEDRGLGDRVTITAPIYGDGKFQKFLDSDVFVFPTWFEAFPGVILEAMQSGLPIVTTREGAIPEIIEDGKTGYLVQQKDVAALAEKMTLLSGDEGMRQKMGAAGRAKFVKEYTSGIFEQEVDKAFKEALAV